MIVRQNYRLINPLVTHSDSFGKLNSVVRESDPCRSIPGRCYSDDFQHISAEEMEHSGGVSTLFVCDMFCLPLSRVFPLIILRVCVVCASTELLDPVRRLYCPFGQLMLRLPLLRRVLPTISSSSGVRLARLDKCNYYYMQCKLHGSSVPLITRRNEPNTAKKYNVREL